jgi:DNA polymerase-3 subunit chi
MTLPKLLEKTLAAGKRALVLASSEARVEALAGALWTYDQDSWLPHGTARDGDAQLQPVWLTTEDAARDDAANGADFLFLTDGAESKHVAGYERCFDIFDGKDENALAAARRRWRQLSGAGFSLAYWRQTGGGWEKQEIGGS